MFNLSLWPREKIAGISITENDAKILVLEKKGEKISLVFFNEARLEEGIIESGELKDERKFLQALKKIIPGRTRWARPIKTIVSLPEILSYYLNVTQSKLLTGTKLSSSIRSQLEIRSPQPITESYWDFEEYPLEDKDVKEIVIASVSKNKIDPYLEVFKKTGFYIIATETHLQGLKRILKLGSETLLLALIQERGVQSAVLKNKIIRFSRFTSWQNIYPVRDYKNMEVPKKEQISNGEREEIQEELLRIIEFYQAQNIGEKISKIYIIKPPAFEIGLEKDLSQNLKIPVEEAKCRFIFEKEAGNIFKNKNNLIPLGPALRALIPRAKDKLISLMARGTEELYEISQILAVSRLVRDGVIIVGVILIIIFAGTTFYLLPQQEAQKTREINLRQARPTMKEIQELQQSIQIFNSKTKTLGQIHQSSPDWTMVIGDIRVRTKPGISITSFSTNLASDTVNLVGKAEDISDLIDFRNTLAFSGLLSGDLTIPFASFETGENINFNYALKFKNKEDIFPFKEIAPAPVPETPQL